jgi:hypothetical protein
VCDAITHTPEIKMLQICEVADRVRQLLDSVLCDVSAQLHAHCSHTKHTKQPEQLESAQRDVWNDNNLVVVQIQPSEAVLLHSGSDLIPFFDGRLCFQVIKLTNANTARETRKTKIAKNKLGILPPRCNPTPKSLLF